MIVSQLPVSEWFAVIGDNAVADAILDRVVHHSHSLELGGKSIRKVLAQALFPVHPYAKLFRKRTIKASGELKTVLQDGNSSD